MSGCVMAGALALGLAAGNRFTLEWTHSVEREAWRETWEVADHHLHLVEAAVKGSGAGMEPGPGGHFQDGWWIWVPDLAPVAELNLAASGMTPSAWRLCGADCVDLGAEPGEALRIAACEGDGKP
ncbi:DUF1850 domain-containing protein [Pseudooceanicola sediminis]|uniref:DUF1850 domain-containing protein n=1 Tax=Pseudooceanicola sediminis TaxID=2211117 RepID=A0A399J0U6_9RHOB|nr:DUF1850 domain-containing protein [Pseudooceanicola sediminis]KAA2315066.1 DUF1850 domain-containing protein [Puniceibacterium sp. HSS470]RII38880.1 DUF1850 domain-containing protein [Pseudooceanicola sediminis]